MNANSEREYFNQLLQKAENYNIFWDESEYDIIGLEQEIDYYKRSIYEADQILRRDYYENLGVI